nr:DUF1549 domain-containing protein [Pseudomonadales bacterium]NIW36735.1 DUF1549 domain-containing protein [Gemmatimonadota bacterium]NIX07716.1 DUF1549 domain-containing protein [Pseudomonadales bacterium]
MTCNVEAGVHPEANRVNQVVDRVNTTATVWLGVTIECAQCHDHKYDPFTMKDYYSLFAFFNNTPLEVQLPSNKTDVSHDFVGPYLDLPLSPAQRNRAGELDREIEAATRSRKELFDDPEAGFPAWLRSISDPDRTPALSGEIAAILKKPEWKRNKKERNRLDAEFLDSRPAIRKLDKTLARLRKERGELKPDKTLVMVELEEPRTTRILKRGNYLTPEEEVQPDTPALLPALPDPAGHPNRLALARWLVRNDNPLTARV